MKIRAAAAVVLIVAMLGCGCQNMLPCHQDTFRRRGSLCGCERRPHLPGASPYSELACRVAEHYAQQFGIAVEVQFKTRQEMESLLLGEYQGEVPSVVFSTEWPFVGAGAQDLTGLVPTDDYLEPAASFWT